MRETRTTKIPLEWMVIQKKTIKRLLLLVVSLALVSGITYIVVNAIINRPAPPPPAQNSAILKFITGNVTVFHAATNTSEKAAENMVLQPGDTIQTSPDSGATIQYIDESTFRVRPGSTVIYKEDRGKDKARRAEHNIESGSVIINSSDKSGILIVNVPGAKAFLQPQTIMKVSTTGPGGNNSFEVNKGAARVSTPKGEENLETGQRLDITRNEIKRSLLPPAPKPKTPASAEQLLLNDDDKVELSWLPTPKAESYNLMISSAQTFPDSAVVIKVDGWTKTKYTWAAPKAGNYFWHVQANTKEGIQSDWCDTANFSIRIKPKLTRNIPININKLDMIGKELIEIAGTTTPNSLVTINSNTQVQSDSTGKFAATINVVKRKQADIDIKALDSNGRSGRIKVKLPL